MAIKGINWSDAKFERFVVARARSMMQGLVDRYIEIMMGLFRASKHGRVYMAGGRLHVASAAGEAPAIQSGLLSQLRGRVRSSNRYSVVMEIRTPAKYMQFLELGTSKMDPRPAWGPALEILTREFRSVARRSF